MSELKPCPCGKLPEELIVTREHDRSKYAMVSGDCCGEWEIEFRADHLTDDVLIKKMANEAWNKAKRTQSQWISVEDRLPEGGAVLINSLSSFGSPVVSVAFIQGNSFYSGTSYPVQRVTHWMPLPQPPKAP